MPVAFDFLPSQIVHLVEILFLSNEEISPVVAWPAHTLGPTPSLMPIFLGLVIVLGGVTALILNIPSLAAGFSHSTPTWLKTPFKHLRRQRHHYGAELLRTYDTYKRSVDDFLNMTRLCRSLQEQLKERDARLLHQRSAIDSLTYDVDGFSAQNEFLRTSKDKLRADKARLKERLRDERERHATDLRDFQKDLESLLHHVEILEADKSASRVKFEEAIQTLRHENATLRRKLLDPSRQEACDHAPQIEELNKRVAFAENALQHITKENESLKQQLVDQQKLYARQQLSQTRRHTQQQSTFVDTLEKFKQQLVEQQEEHIQQQEILAQRIAQAKADKSKIKAKLKHARAEAETKSANLERLQTELVEKDHQHAEQYDSFEQDLHFAYVESHFERQMYKGQLSTAEAESLALRQQLADLFNRHKDQSSRLNHTEAGLREVSWAQEEMSSRLQAALAEKQVSGHLEDMLAEDLRRRNDEYETLEISFDVLESAYSFLAAELVRTEHMLKDALAGRRPMLDPEDISVTDPEHEDEDADARDEEEDNTYASTSSCNLDRERDHDETCTVSTSSLSERSWPTTPGLVHTPDTTSRSSPSSPIVATPPLPSLFLPRMRSSHHDQDDHCLSPYSEPPSDSDPDDLFDTWSMNSLPISHN